MPNGDGGQIAAILGEDTRSSTPGSSANPWNLRLNSRQDVTVSDRPCGWLRREDSNLRYTIQKPLPHPQPSLDFGLPKSVSVGGPAPSPARAGPRASAYRAFGQWEAAQSRAASDKGTEVMPKLSDTQAVLLATAAARSDLSVLPPPETLTLKGAALERTLSALIRRGLIAEAAVERRARKSKWVVEEDDTAQAPAPGDHPRRSRRHRCRARH